MDGGAPEIGTEFAPEPLSTSTASPSTRRGTPSSAVRGRIIVVQSGREAEAEILGPPFASDDDDDDHRVAEALAEDLGLEPEAEPAALARLRRAACQLVRRHRADIETIASAQTPTFASGAGLLTT